MFQCQEDYKLFNELIIDTDKGVGRRARVFTWFRPNKPELFIPPPMTDEEVLHLLRLNEQSSCQYHYVDADDWLRLLCVGPHRLSGRP